MEIPSLKSLSLEKENIIKDVTNLFRLKTLKKETIDTKVKEIRNFLRLENIEKIKDRIFRDITNVFRLEKGNEAIEDIILRNI